MGLPRLPLEPVLSALSALALGIGLAACSGGGGGSADGGVCGICGPNGTDVLEDLTGRTAAGHPVIELNYLAAEDCPLACGGEAVDRVAVRWDTDARAIVVEDMSVDVDHSQGNLTSTEDGFSVQWNGLEATAEIIIIDSGHHTIRYTEGPDTAEVDCAIDGDQVVCM